MRPIPVAFHIWFLEVHTYGIGLALTFWFGLRYTERRLRKAGYPWQWVTGMFVWVIVAAIVGARALHVLSNLSLLLPLSEPGLRHLAGRAVLVRRPASSRCPWPSSAPAGAAPNCRPCALPT